MVPRGILCTAARGLVDGIGLVASHDTDAVFTEQFPVLGVPREGRQGKGGKDAEVCAKS